MHILTIIEYFLEKKEIIHSQELTSLFWKHLYTTIFNLLEDYATLCKGMSTNITTQGPSESKSQFTTRISELLTHLFNISFISAQRHCEVAWREIKKICKTFMNYPIFINTWVSLIKIKTNLLINKIYNTSQSDTEIFFLGANFKSPFQRTHDTSQPSTTPSKANTTEPLRTSTSSHTASTSLSPTRLPQRQCSHSTQSITHPGDCPKSTNTLPLSSLNPFTSSKTSTLSHTTQPLESYIVSRHKETCQYHVTNVLNASSDAISQSDLHSLSDRRSVYAQRCQCGILIGAPDENKGFGFNYQIIKKEEVLQALYNIYITIYRKEKNLEISSAQTASLGFGYGYAGFGEEEKLNWKSGGGRCMEEDAANSEADIINRRIINSKLYIYFHNWIHLFYVIPHPTKILQREAFTALVKG
jgi:hypothetical protein